MTTEIVQEEKLPLSRSLSYSLGNMSSQLLQWAVQMFIMDFYACSNPDKRLLSIATVSSILMIGRILDAPLEPLVGYWSDQRTNTRWGRRIPYLLFFGLPLCIFFSLIWFPPFKPHTNAMAGWLIFTNTGFFLLITMVICPYLALLPEIAVTSKGRIFVNQLMQVFLFIGTGIVMALPMFFNPVNDHPQMFLIIAVLGLISIYIPVFTINEKKLSRKRDDEESYSLLEALKWTFKNKAFVMYVIASVFFWVGFQVVMNGLKFIVNVLLDKPDDFLTILFGITLVSILISFVIINKLSTRFSKKTIYLGSNFLMAVIIPLEYLLRLDNVMGLPTLPLAILIFFLLGVPMAGILSAGMPLLADIADYDAKITGRRREAIFFGAQGILNKLAIALSFGISGFLFDRYGYTHDNPLGIQLLGPVTGAIILVGCFLFYFYPLNEKTLELEPVRLFKK